MIRAKTVVLSFALSLTACNLAPKYSRPDFSLPSSWRNEPIAGEDLTNTAWWDRFEDPQMGKLIQLALANNNDLQVAVWRVYEYFAQYQSTRSSLFPQITGNGSALKERLPVDSNFLPPGSNTITPDFHMDLALSYEIDFWGTNRNATTAAFQEYLAEIENRRTVVLTLIGSVAEAYIILKQLNLQLETALKLMTTYEGLR
jgi:multidrug efflux system outer membrane protein